MQTAMAAEDTSARKASKQQAARTPEAKATASSKPANSQWHPNRKRPSIHEEGILKRVCDGLTEGLSIKQTCAPDDMPRWQEVYLEIQRDEAVRTAIAQAREAQQEVIADDIVDMADLATAEDHNVVKLRIWARQWRAAKLAPKKYGDNQKVEVNHNIKIAEEHAAALIELSRRKREAEGKLIDVTPNPSLDKGGDSESNQQLMQVLPRIEDDAG